MVAEIPKHQTDQDAQKTVEGAVARGVVQDRLSIRSILTKINIRDRRQASAR